jgi:peptide/nickel transport system substrate-binding protein
MSSLPRLGIALLLSALVACGETAPADAPPAAAGATDQRDALVIASQSDAENLLYVVSQSASDSDIISNLNVGLVDEDFDCELQWKPAIATEWSWSEDGRVLSMTLRQDITWQDGTPVTAEDVAFTYDLVGDPLVASPRLASVERMLEGARPKIVDPTHIEWHFTEAYDRNTQMAHVGLPLAPKHVLGSADRATLRGNDFTRSPLVNGRWKLAAWDRGQRIVLEPNEKWSGPADQAPKLKRVIFRVLPEYATRLVELEKGGIDLMQSIQVADADRLRQQHPEIKLHRRGWRSMDYVAWNGIDPADWKKQTEALKPGEKPDLARVKPHPIFADKGVRRALAKAIDVDKLINDLLTSKVSGESYGRPAIGTVTPALCQMVNEDVQRLPFDPAATRAELAGLGWKDTDGDAVVDKGGVPLRFTLITNSGNPRRADAAVIIQSLLKDVGVDMRIESVESNAFFERLRKKDYEAALSGWSAALFVDPTNVWHSGVEHEFNFTSYNNPAVDALIERGMAEPDPEKAALIWKEMQAVLYEDQPYAFLYWMDEIVGVHERFEDTKIDVLSPYRDLHEWWVPEEKVKYKR